HVEPARDPRQAVRRAQRPRLLRRPGGVPRPRGPGGLPAGRAPRGADRRRGSRRAARRLRGLHPAPHRQVAGAGPDLTLRPFAAADVPALAAVIAAPDVARWWDDGAPWEDESDATMLTIVADGRIVGLIQYAEELDPKYRHASIDIFVDPARHNQGIGTRAIRELVRHLIEDRGHHRITIDPAAHNAQAIRAYEK